MGFAERFENGHTSIPETSCWWWIAAQSSAGYGQIWRDDRVWYAHRVSYEIHIGPIPDGHFICHKCDNPSCVNPDHLFAGTNQDNVDDMIKKGRDRKKGELNPSNKLTADQVRAIRVDPRTTESIANDYGVVRHTIGDIKRRKIWGWLK